jgi:hypothetical protein
MASLDPQVIFAGATAEAGNALATWLLGKNGAASVSGLQNLAANLPLIPVGKVTPFNLGVISAQLSAINSAATSQNADAKFLSQIGSVIALVSNEEAAASGGNITTSQAVLVAAATNVANGINNALGFFEGQQSVLAAVPAAAQVAKP